MGLQSGTGGEYGGDARYNKLNSGWGGSQVVESAELRGVG